MSHFFFRHFSILLLRLSQITSKCLASEKGKKNNNPKPHTGGSLLLTKSLIAKGQL